MKRRNWETSITREEVMHLLHAGRYLDLLARLEEARSRLPYDLELLRSVRVLQHHMRESMRCAG